MGLASQVPAAADEFAGGKFDVGISKVDHGLALVFRSLIALIKKTLSHFSLLNSSIR
jgi:hypothetical protein